MKRCVVCGRDFNPDDAPASAAEEAGKIMAAELFGDVGDLCPTCLAGRGTLGMMYCREFFD